MTESTIILENFTGKQLYEYATKTLNLEVATNAAKSQIVAVLKAAGKTGEDLQLALDAAPAKVEYSKEETPKSTKKIEKGSSEYWEEKVTITIAVDRTAGGDQPVWAGVNGRGIFIPRGKPVSVARKYLHVLENAVQFVYPEIVKVDDGVQEVPEPRKVPEYSVAALESTVRE